MDYSEIENEALRLKIEAAAEALEEEGLTPVALVRQGEDVAGRPFVLAENGNGYRLILRLSDAYADAKLVVEDPADSEEGQEYLELIELEDGEVVP